MPNLSAPIRRDHNLLGLGVLAGFSWTAYLAIAWSAQSLHETGSGRHSLLLLLALFAVAFACYIVAIRLAVRARQGPPLLMLILASGILFRGTMLFSNPIEEIDLYRYLWDGAVVTQGVSPFRYSPQQVLAGTNNGELPDDLARLVRLRDSSEEMMTILKRVHFGELPTIYPPVGQAVFALATWVTPPTGSLLTRLVIMKTWFVSFDLATLLLVIQLLKFAGRPVGLALIYAWCPLLIKEVANSGHLDSLAFCLATVAAYLTVQASYAPGQLRSPQQTAVLATLVLALAVGAKLYPVILAPLVLGTFLCRHGWRFTVLPALAFGLVVALLAWPMWPSEGQGSTWGRSDFDPAQVAVVSDDAPPFPPQEITADPRDPSQSLRAFLSEWEMNDFLFLLVVENLRPTAGLPPGETAWFSIIPDRWRAALVAFAGRYLGLDARRTPFFIARGLTSVAFVVIAGWFAWRAAAERDAEQWLSAAFLTVAGFWLLLPTQNPWYWTWTLPFLPFARNRAWLAMSGLAFLYYFRFWLMRHYSDAPLFDTPYAGPAFFDYIVVWVEYGPWFLWLTWDCFRRGRIPLASSLRMGRD